MIEKALTSRVTGIETDIVALNVAPTSNAETSSTPAETQPASTSNDQPVTDSPYDEDDSVRRYPGLASYIVGWAISRDAVMKAFKTTDTRDMRVTENIHRFAYDYVEPTGDWDVRLGKYHYTPEGLEARLDKWKEFPEELLQIHK